VISFVPTLIRYGETMVDLFFVISGYVFAHVYLRDGDGLRGGARNFMVARIARIYPLHIATALMMFLLLLYGSFPDEQIYSDAYHLLLNALMLQESGLEHGLSLNRPAWSISIEIYCYVVFMLTTLIFKHRSRQVFFGLVVIGLLLRTMVPSQTSECIARGLVGYFAGCLLYCYWNTLVTIPKPLVAAFMVAPLIADTSLLHPGFFSSLMTWPALIILTKNARVLKSAPLQWLGERSYSIYMVHAPVYLAVSMILFGGSIPGPQFSATAVALVVLLTLTIAHVSYTWFEVPMRSWIKARFAAEALNGKPAHAAPLLPNP
jgi:peptidoglycan/LPS O-acetylase OafA/YrhL